MANRKIGGQKAKAFGQLFEDIFTLRCRSLGVALTRIPDSCRQVSGLRLIRVRSPYDFVVTKTGKTCFLDAKTTEGKRFVHSQIDPHQVKQLVVHEKQGACAGYLIWLREEDEVIFISSLILATFEGTTGSIGAWDPGIMRLGTHREFDLLKLILSGSQMSHEAFGLSIQK